MSKKKSPFVEKRARMAMHAVRIYPAYDGCALRASIVDLMTDLLHLAERKKCCPHLLMATAVIHYSEEQEDNE